MRCLLSWSYSPSKLQFSLLYLRFCLNKMSPFIYTFPLCLLFNRTCHSVFTFCLIKFLVKVSHWEKAEAFNKMFIATPSFEFLHIMWRSNSESKSSKIAFQTAASNIFFSLREVPDYIGIWLSSWNRDHNCKRVRRRRSFGPTNDQLFSPLVFRTRRSNPLHSIPPTPPSTLSKYWGGRCHNWAWVLSLFCR